MGTAVNLTHEAATPPGLTVTVKVKLKSVEGRKLAFPIIADDGVDKISEGTHERFIISASRVQRENEGKGSKRDSLVRRNITQRTLCDRGCSV